MTKREQITEMLKEIGIPQHVSGFRYLTEAILYVSDPQKSGCSITKELYPMVAKKFGSTGNKVERAVRRAIELGFDNASPDTIYKYFGNSIRFEKGKATRRRRS